MGACETQGQEVFGLESRQASFVAVHEYAAPKWRRDEIHVMNRETFILMGFRLNLFDMKPRDSQRVMSEG